MSLTTSHNFSPGPAAFPPEVIKKLQDAVANYADSGISILEISHRSEQFMVSNQSAMSLIRELLIIPDNYKILFMQGGATSQFSAIVYNLLVDRHDVLDYIVTGTWYNHI